MDRSEHLRKIVAQLAGLSAESIDPDFSLKSRGLQSSVRRAALAAAIRRHLGVNVTEVYTVFTFRELEAAVFGEGGRATGSSVNLATLPKPIAVTTPSRSEDLACGIDVEMVDAMPMTDDYWEHEFYKGSFSKDEIAYCVLQDNPRMHFAARWCAKEALVKCNPEFKGQSFVTMEVIRSDSGGVSLAYHGNGTSRKLPVAVSISHTEIMAVAVVVRREK